MVTKLKYTLLFCLTAWSVNVWVEYFEKKNTQQTVIIHEQAPAQETIIKPKTPTKLTGNFWKWEAQGRLKLIDALLDDDDVVAMRENWDQNKPDIVKEAEYVAQIQVKAYQMHHMLKPAKIELIPLRGDANGLYIPSEATIYLNSRMQWGDLPFERFMEVVLHENMHHIMTRGMIAFHKDDPLRQDFIALSNAAFFHGKTGMAQDGREIPQVNPQELVAYRTQRAARYAGILGANIPAWEMSTRMQEIRVITREAGLD